MKRVYTEGGQLIVDKLDKATNFFKRFMGLMGREQLTNDAGLLIVPCNSVHSCFMKFPIDVVFLTKENRIVYIYENMKPWRVSKIIKEAYMVLELPKGRVTEVGLKVGEQIKFE